ncbi:NAD-dependent epimerase/dehydratase family protein [Metabacillus herbersteinensis]|uniref:NAD-dependent epimerase/dehydratase family protein n=1 Tax=Metabacillus herbersteinensis TaxID=283816 RepID=A0ABV6GF31_9BACI
MKKVAVFGVQTFLGFAFCEHLLSQGIEVEGVIVEPIEREHKARFEERLMNIGRNSLLKIDNSVQIDEKLKEIDMIVYCCDDLVEENCSNADLKNLQKATTLSKVNKIPFVLLSSHHVYGEKRELLEDETAPKATSVKGKHQKTCENHLKNEINHDSYAIFRFPTLYGPWQPVNESIHLMLMNKHIDLLNLPLSIVEDLVYIDDAVQTLWHLVNEKLNGQILHIYDSDSIDNEQEPPKSQLSNERKYKMRKKISLQEGLNRQLDHIVQFEEK